MENLTFVIALLTSTDGLTGGHAGMPVQRKHRRRLIRGGVSGSCRTCVCNISLSLPLGSPRVLFVEYLLQALKIGIESNEAGRSLEEGLPTCVVRQTIE